MGDTSAYIRIISARHNKDEEWNGGIAQFFLNRSSGWRQVISFTSRPLCLREKNVRYQVGRWQEIPRVGLYAWIKIKITSTRLCH